MPTMDLYRDDFPHGSQAGYEAGCHGNAECGNFGSKEFVTCREAQIARAGDYALRKLPAIEVLRRDIVWPPQPATAAKPRKPLPTEPMPSVNAVGNPAKDDHDATARATVVPALGIDPTPAAPAQKLTIDDPEFPHGTAKGYDWGCRLRDACPAKALTDVSCANAANQRGKDRRAALESGEAQPRYKSAAKPNAAIDREKFVDQLAGYPTTEDAPTLAGVSAAIEDLTQARNELSKAKSLLEEISAAHALVVAERDNLADELATVRRANSSLATAIHDLEVEKAPWMSDGETQLADPGTVEISKDVTAPPGAHVTITIHVGSN